MRQSSFHVFQSVEHLLGITTAQIAAPAAEHEQGITGNQVLAYSVTGRTRGVARGMQHLDVSVPQPDVITAMMQRWQVQVRTPEAGLVF